MAATHQRKHERLVTPVLPEAHQPRGAYARLGFPPFRGGLLIADGASHSPVPRCHRLVPRAAEAERPVSRGLALSGSLGGSLVEHLLVGDRREHLAGAVAPPMVVGIDERGDLPACLVLGGEVPSR